MEHNRYFIIHNKKDDGGFNAKVYKNGEVIDVFDVSDESSLNYTINKYRGNITDDYNSFNTASLNNPRSILNDDLILLKDFSGDAYYILDKSQDRVGLINIDTLRMSIKLEEHMVLVNMIKIYVLDSPWARNELYKVSLDNDVFTIQLDDTITIKMSKEDIKKLLNISNEDRCNMWSNYAPGCHVYNMSNNKKAIVNSFGELYMYSIDEFNELKRKLCMYIDKGDYTIPETFDIFGVSHTVRWVFGYIHISAYSVTGPFIFSVKSIDDLDIKSCLINNGNFVVYYSPKKDSIVTILADNIRFSVRDNYIDELFTAIINNDTEKDDITIVKDGKIKFCIYSTEGDTIDGYSTRYISDANEEYDIDFTICDNEYLVTLYKDDIIEYLKTRNILN